MLTASTGGASKRPLNGVIRNLDSARGFHIAIMAQETDWFKYLNGLVTRNLDPGLIFVNAGFAGKTKNLLAQNVAHDFARAAFN